MAEAGVTEAEAWEIAPTNLPTRLGQMEAQLFDEAPGLILLTSPTMLAPSDLTDPAFCSREIFAGAHYFVIDRSSFFLVDPSTEGALAAFEGFTASIIQAGESMSSSVLSCQDGRIVAVEQQRAPKT